MKQCSLAIALLLVTIIISCSLIMFLHLTTEQPSSFSDNVISDTKYYSTKVETYAAPTATNILIGPITINLYTGNVIIADGVTLDSASIVFWEYIETVYPTH